MVADFSDQEDIVDDRLLSRKQETEIYTNALKAMYETAFQANAEIYDSAFSLTKGFSDISVESILADSRIIKTLRYAMAPTISQMKFGQFVGLSSVDKFEKEKFDLLYGKICAYLTNRDVYVRDAYACADENYRLNLRVVTEYPWSNQFASNMFLRPTREEIESFDPEWHIVCAPGFYADPEIDGTRQPPVHSVLAFA